MELIAKDFFINDPKAIPQVQNKPKKVEFEVSYNDTEKMNYNKFDTRIDHGS